MKESLSMHPNVYRAAKSGDFQSPEFQSLIAAISENGEDLFHQTTPNGNNILHVAAQYKRVDFIRDLLQHPAGLSLLWQGNYRRDTPLHAAAKLGSNHVVQVFINVAKRLAQPDAWKELLRRPNLHEDTSLHHAIRGGHKLVVELLIKEDPELCDITNAVHESPLYLAVHQRHWEIIDSILKVLPLPISYKGPKGLTALHAAVHFSLPNWQKILVTIPEMIKEGDDMGWTPLHYAACFGNVEAVELLLGHNTSVAYVLDKEGASALHIAAFRGHVPVIDVLVKSCPDACDMINTKGQTALHAAVIGGQVNVVKHIIREPNLEDLINEEDTDGNTALHLAAVHRRDKILCTLARAKRVNCLATNKDHLTALDIFFASEEVGFRIIGVSLGLKRSHGFPVIHNWVIEHVKKRLDEQFVGSQPAGSITTGNNTANRENSESIKSIFDSQLLVAAFIATVTFAATFTMPGGYNNDGPNQGMATLAGKVAFKAFVIFNTIAFAFSIRALFFRYRTSFLSDQEKMVPTSFVGCNIKIAMLGMVLAFASGTCVVLTRTSWLGIVPYVVVGYFVADYLIADFLNPKMHFIAWNIQPFNSLRWLRRGYGIR